MASFIHRQRLWSLFAQVAAQVVALVGALGSGLFQNTQAAELGWSGKQEEASLGSKFNLGLRLDCNHEFNRNVGAAQGCLNLSGLRVGFQERLHNQVGARLSLNPFATLSRRYDKTPLADPKPYLHDTSLGVIESYQLVWSPRAKLDVALELYEGAARFPDTSNLALTASFADPGAKQSALSVTYHLPMLAGARVKFVGGNGEGELLGNSDPQQFFGFEFHSQLLQGLELHAGLSTDGNQVGSEAFAWSGREYEKNCGIENSKLSHVGYSTHRMAISVETNGSLPFARGLRLGAGWHKSTFADNDKDKDSVPSLYDLEKCGRLDPDQLFLEDPNHELANTMRRTSVGVNGSYRILDRYFFGFDYAKRQIQSDLAYFQICEQFDGSQCINPSSPGKSLAQWSYSLGAGMDLSEGLTLSLSYQGSAYEQLYRKIYFEGPNAKANRTRETFNARINYMWD